jgi:hemerythrin-like domain-containing protein
MPDEGVKPFKTDLSPDTERHGLAKGLNRIHLVISRGVAVARRQSHAYASGEAAEPSVAAGFADYLRALVSVLHGHHTVEDEVAFPALRDRFPDAPWDLLVEEHRAVAPVLADLEGHAERIRQQPSPDTWASAAETLDRLAALWDPHYQREEAYFTVPVLARVVPHDEQAGLVAKMAAHSQQHTGPDYLVVPFLLYNLDGDERRAMSALFPPVVTEQLVPVVWQEKWSPMKPFLLG